MKKIFSTTLFMLCGLILFAQTQLQVPQAVNQAFKDANPTHDFVTWTMDGANYVASSIDLNHMHHTSVYGSNGDLLRTESEVPFSQAPESIVNYFNKNLPAVAHYTVWKVESKDGKTSYFVTYNDQASETPQGKSSARVNFDGFGNVAK
jgi:hypothetical protein